MLLRNTLSSLQDPDGGGLLNKSRKALEVLWGISAIRALFYHKGIKFNAFLYKKTQLLL